jgi:uncharacterized membrane protein YdjX (TVP38/TMEM64 family)
MASSSPSVPWKKVALAVVLGALFLGAYRLGAFDAVRDPARLRETLRAYGPEGMLVYLLVVAVLQPVGVPGVMFILVASLVWPPAIAMPLSLTACTVSTVIGFSFSRYLARDWVERRIPERWRKYDDQIAARGFVTVIVLRSIFWMNPTLHALFGLSRVRFATHLLASMLAYLVPVIALTFLGDRAMGLLRSVPAAGWALIAGLVGVAAIVGWSVRSCVRRRVAIG